MYKEIIILAKSTKHGEYCIAGIDTTTGEWIRPVSTNIANEGSVPVNDITYDDGNRSIQFNFEYNNSEYKYFKISDEIIKKKYANKCDGTYNHRDNLPVVFSLTDKYKRTGMYYKMVAQMFY